MSGTTYRQLLENKIVLSGHSGFDVDPADLHPGNFPHQNDAIIWAASLGHALIAMSFGLGKTRIQCELARLISDHLGHPFLVICPLGVKHQFSEEDGPALGMTWRYVRNDAEVLEAAKETPYLITNYERVRDGGIHPEQHNFSGVSLDEGSVLRSLDSKTQDVFKRVFKDVPYRFVCTATPSPNEYKELIYYAEFLGVMDHGQALTRWFKRDSQHAGHLTLMPSQEENFWMWVASWALFLFKPSDLGYSDRGYDLPKLNVHWQRISVDHSRAWQQVDDRNQRRLFLDAAGGVSQASAEKRETLSGRMEEMQRIMAEHAIGNDGKPRHWLLWHTLEREREAIEKAVPEAVTVYGSQDLDERETDILDFVHGRIPILATKPEIAGSGCNLQYFCHSSIFLGVDYKFQDFIQAIHRTYRFQQRNEVDVWIIYAESEDSVIEVLRHKWQQHDRLTEKMRSIVQKYGLSHQAMKRDLTRSIGVTRMEVRGKLFTAVNNDCVEEMKHVASDTVGLIHTSIPFGNHYEYSTQVEDFGHNPSDDAFWKQMDFLIPELLRVLSPGRLAAIHVKDRILYGHQTHSGFMEVSPFSDECVMAFRKHGFLYEGRRTIVTDVVRENNSTYRLGWSECTVDSSKMGCGLPEYLLLFRKAPSDPTTARADTYIAHTKDEYTRGRWQIDAHSLWRSNGNRLLYPDEFATMNPKDVSSIFEAEQLSGQPYDYERHVTISDKLEKRKRLPADFMLLPPKVTKSPKDLVWDDIVYMRTLNTSQASRKRENHICPLPLDIVERTINLYSNPGELVLDPFAGLFTVPYMALKLGRLAHGTELNPAYFTDGVKYCQDMERQVTSPTLFDYLAAQNASASQPAAD